MKIIFILIFISISNLVFAQTDWVKWGKANYSYALPQNNSKRDFALNGNSAGRIVLKSFADAYWFVISDVDGDNCSFSPTCSHFFLQAVHATNIFQGTLMFFDRFTRDMDIYEKYNHYPVVKDGHYYDPVSLYALEKSKINYLPPSEVVNK